MSQVESHRGSEENTLVRKSARLVPGRLNNRHPRLGHGHIFSIAMPSHAHSLLCNMSNSSVQVLPVLCGSSGALLLGAWRQGEQQASDTSSKASTANCIT